MRIWLFSVLLLIASPLCYAQYYNGYQDVRTGVSDPQKYGRDNDPFVFCTQGVKNGKVWRVITPNSPAHAMILVGWVNIAPYCPWPSTEGYEPYCEGWPQDDVTAWNHWAEICYAGGDRSDWTGPGRPENSPTNH